MRSRSLACRQMSSSSGLTESGSPSSVCPASARANTSNWLTRRISRSTSSFVSEITSARSCGSIGGSRRNSSMLPRTVVSGVRSSCDASATKRRCESSACSSWRYAVSSSANIALKVIASWPTSSVGPMCCTRRLKSCSAPMVCAVCVIRSMGLSAVPASTQPAANATTITRLHPMIRIQRRVANDCSRSPMGTANWMIEAGAIGRGKRPAVDQQGLILNRRGFEPTQSALSGDGSQPGVAQRQGHIAEIGSARKHDAVQAAGLRPPARQRAARHGGVERFRPRRRRALPGSTALAVSGSAAGDWRRRRPGAPGWT